MLKRLSLSTALFFLICAQVYSCTIFCFTYQGKTYFCNNEDWTDPITEIRFHPAENGNYAWVSLGFTNNWAQGGVNEHGLCFDWVAGGGPFGWQADPQKKDYQGNLSEELLRKCKNVDEAIAFYEAYNEKHLDYSRTLIGDKEGNSILVHWKDGKLAITRGTGALHSCGVGKDVVDERFSALKNDFHVADLVHALNEGSSVGLGSTKYSNVIDISSGTITLFQNRDYSQYVEIDFQAKLRAGKSEHRIADLFDPRQQQEHVKLFAKPFDQRHQTAIEQVETGLGPKVMFQSEEGWTIDERMKHYGVPGLCIAVVKDHKVAWSKGYGVKDRESGEPVDANTLFQCASISKPVSAAAALRLVEQGKLSLDEDINSFLTSWKLPPNEFTTDRAVTLRDILSHTGGVTVHGFRGYRADEKTPSLVEVLDGKSPANTNAIRIDKTPGGDFRYSGGGYCVAQQAMEDTTGKPFFQLMNDEVLERLRMSHCTFAQPLPLDRETEAATGYFENGQRVPGERHVYPEMAAAGLYATPSELAQFWIELQNAYAGQSDRLLSRQMATTMLTPVDKMGLGVAVVDRDGEVYIGHGGRNEGFVCNARVHRDRGYGVVVMTNGSHAELVDEIIDSVARVYQWKHYGFPVFTKTSIRPDVARKVSGRYDLDGSLVHFEIEGDGIVVTANGKTFPVFAVGENQFASKSFDDLIVLEDGKDGSFVLALRKPWQKKEAGKSLRRLNEGEKLPLELLAAGKADAAIEQLLELQKHNPNAPLVNEERLNNLGYEYLGDKKIELAIGVFRANVALHPNAFNTYDSLGEAYLLNGDKVLGKLNYRKSLDLNPGNQFAIEVLKRLENE